MFKIKYSSTLFCFCTKRTSRISRAYIFICIKQRLVKKSNEIMAYYYVVENKVFHIFTILSGALR